jgi:hypothetical protein
MVFVAHGGRQCGAGKIERVYAVGHTTLPDFRTGAVTQKRRVAVRGVVAPSGHETGDIETPAERVAEPGLETVLLRVIDRAGARAEQRTFEAFGIGVVDDAGHRNGGAGGCGKLTRVVGRHREELHRLRRRVLMVVRDGRPQAALRPSAHVRRHLAAAWRVVLAVL